MPNHQKLCNKKVEKGKVNGNLIFEINQQQTVLCEIGIKFFFNKRGDRKYCIKNSDREGYVFNEKKSKIDCEWDGEIFEVSKTKGAFSKYVSIKFSPEILQNCRNIEHEKIGNAAR